MTGSATEDVTVRLPPDADPDTAPVSLFGQAVLTFHVMGLFRTPPGWNLWVSGSPNRPKEGIYPLAGVIETDWSPYTFTMNWRFLRRNHWVRFERDEPIAFIFPVQRNALELMQPKLVPLEANPALLAAFTAWSQSRTEFQTLVSKDPPASGLSQVAEALLPRRRYGGAAGYRGSSHKTEAQAIRARRTVKIRTTHDRHRCQHLCSRSSPLRPGPTSHRASRKSRPALIGAGGSRTGAAQNL